MTLQLDRYQVAKQEMLAATLSLDPKRIMAARIALDAAIKAIATAEYVAVN